MTVNPNADDQNSGRISQTGDDCERLRELLPAYSLGATDAEETRFVEQMLARCPDVAAELDNYQQLHDAMLVITAPVPPPADLRGKILAAAGAAETRVHQPAVAPALTLVPKTTPPRRPLWGQIAAVAAVIVLVGSNLYWLNHVETMRAREDEILSLVQQQNEMLASLGGRDTRQIQLASTSTTAPAEAVLFWRPGADLAVLTTTGLPALEPDRAYQLWLIRGDQPVGAGVFEVSHDGRGILILEPSDEIGDFDAIGITEEPAGGSPLPTTDVLLLAQV